MKPALRRIMWVLGAMCGAIAFVNAAVDPARLAAAEALFNGSRPAEAQAAYEAIARDDPQNFIAHLRLGVLALRRDDPEQAVAELERATALEPKNAEAHRILGDAYGRAAQKKGVFGGLGLGKKCLAAYQKAAELDPQSVDAHASLFDFYRIAPALAGGSKEKALAEAATLKQLEPMRGRIAFATFYAAEKQYDRAFAEFDEVLKTDPDDFNALYQIGRIAAVTGQQLDRGIAALRRSVTVALPPEHEGPGRAAAQWRLGLLLEKKNDRAGAHAAYEAAVKLDPNFRPAAEALRKLR